MNEKIKDLLGVAIVIAILILAVSGWRYADSYSKAIEPSSFRSFSVMGEGKVIAIPDIARLSLTVITEGGVDLAALQQTNTNKMNGTIAFIKSQGVEEKDITTTQYNVQPRYERFSCPPERGICPPPEIVGYTIRQTLEVKVRNFEKIGAILSESVSRGVNSVSGPTFTVDDSSKIENEARMEAIQNAQEKAQAIAEAGGFAVGRLLGIDEGGFGPIPFYARGIGGDIASLESAPSPSIEPGSQEITVQVMLRYEIK